MAYKTALNLGDPFNYLSFKLYCVSITLDLTFSTRFPNLKIVWLSEYIKSAQF